MKRWPHARAFALEPNQALHPGLGDLPLTLIPCALHTHGDGVQLHINTNTEASSVVREIFGHVETFPVPTVTMADVIARAGGRVDLMKMDIEGAEIAVLESVPDSALAGVHQLSVEYHEFMFPEQHGAFPRIDAKLRRSGFTRINFSWPGYGNVLYFRQRELGVGPFFAPWKSIARALLLPQVKKFEVQPRLRG